MRKKVIIASDFLVGLLLDPEDLFFGLHLVFGTKSALRSVKTFFFWSSPNFWVEIGPSIREDFFFLVLYLFFLVFTV